MPDGTAQTVKRGRKFDQVLEGARDVFMKVGFEGASVDEIAKAAKVSKATLYSYFPDKRLLFMEVAKIECLRQADQAIDTIDKSAPISDVLHDIAAQMVGFFTSDFGQRIFRICVGEADRFPEIGQEFYASGPALARDRIAGYLRCAQEKGQLDIDDFEFAAEQFAELCKTNLFPRMVFSVSDTFTTEEKERVINGAVEMFMARYGTSA
jgi:AcrR family transcriptional regulator